MAKNREKAQTPQAVKKRGETYSNNTTRRKALNRLRRYKSDGFSGVDAQAEYKPAPKKKTAPKKKVQGLSELFTQGKFVFSRVASLFSPLDSEQLVSFHLWAHDHSHPTGEPNMAAADFLEYVFTTSGVELDVKQGRQLLRELGFKWKKLKKGYYVKKMKEEWVRKHRKDVVPLIEVIFPCQPDSTHSL